jgi:AcrR family transcriptional regulator
MTTTATAPMPSTARDAQRQEDPRVERTRALVIAAAVELLMQDGPGAISHASVAAAANVSRTTVYNHWPTREDLLRSTIDSMDQSMPDADDLTGALRIDLGILCQHLVGDLLDDQRAPLIANMMERALHDTVVESVRNQFLAEFRGLLALVLDRATIAGELRDDIDVDRAMAGLLGSLLFARYMSPGPFDQDVADALIDDFVRVNARR